MDEEEFKKSISNNNFNQIETILEAERKAIIVLLNSKRDIVGLLSDTNKDHEEVNKITDCFNKVIIKRVKNLIHKLSNCIN